MVAYCRDNTAALAAPINQAQEKETERRAKKALPFEFYEQEQFAKGDKENKMFLLAVAEEAFEWLEIDFEVLDA